MLEKNVKAALSRIPGAVRRQGEGLFLKTPLYKAKRHVMPVYINRALFMELFSCIVEPSWQEMSAAIEACFCTTIEKENSTGEEVGTAYVDYQADPLDLSLSGNLGSGRAYYSGDVFNIKGERTPLAKSTQKKFSDGLLEMERCIWETLVANALQGSISTGLGSVLAILDMNELCTVGWRGHPVKRGKILRVDKDGSLDRVTHLFYRKQPLQQKDWDFCAKAFGRLEGDKFIERIIHGTWSSGNISPQGHLIDFDTVSSVKGRSPQFSSSRWYHENYFGFEHNGQLNVLRAMAGDPGLNPDNIRFEGLKQKMLSEMRGQLATGFVSLMGFAQPGDIYAQFKTEIDELIELWMELARKGFKKHDEFSSKNIYSVALHLFDFSAFFRIYPLQKRLGLFKPQEAIALMTENTAWDNPYEEAGDTGRLDIEREHLEKVYAVIDEHFVASDEEVQLLKLAALGFVKKYDRLHQEITLATNADLRDIETRAYIINEDRFFMFPAYTVTYCLAQNEAGYSPKELDAVIEALILSNRRTLGARRITDVQLYKEGYCYTELDDSGGHRLGFVFYNNKPLPTGAYIEADGCKLKLSANKHKVEFISRKLDNTRLIKHFSRESSLHMKRIALINKNSIKNITSLLDE